MEKLFNDILLGLSKVDMHILVKDLNGNIIYCNSELSCLLDTTQLETKVVIHNNHFFERKKTDLGNGLVMSTFTEITSYYKKVEKLKKDFLTGLDTRKTFLGKLKTTIGEEFDENSFSLIMGDIDFFKTINDTYGHVTGDKILQELSIILYNSIRNDDLIGRFGGEEFIFVLPNTPPDNASILFERIRQKIEQHDFIIDGNNLKITMTFGIAGSVRDKSLEDIIKDADDALYNGKENGRNQVVLSDTYHNKIKKK